MLPARRMAYCVEREWTQCVDAENFSISLKRTQCEKCKHWKFLSDVMASSSLTFGESINNVCLFMSFIRFFADRAAVRMESRDAKKGKCTYVWDGRHHTGAIGSSRFIIFGPYFYLGVSNQT